MFRVSALLGVDVAFHQFADSVFLDARRITTIGLDEKGTFDEQRKKASQLASAIGVDVTRIVWADLLLGRASLTLSGRPPFECNSGGPEAAMNS